MIAAGFGREGFIRRNGITARAIEPISIGRTAIRCLFLQMRRVGELFGVIVTELFKLYALLVGDLDGRVLVGEPLTASTGVIFDITAVRTVGLLIRDLRKTVNVIELFFKHGKAYVTDLRRVLGGVLDIRTVLYVAVVSLAELTLVPMDS